MPIVNNARIVLSEYAPGVVRTAKPSGTTPQLSR
jgi:hypothetical protein